MKKILIVLLALIALTLCGCKTSDDTEDIVFTTYESHMEEEAFSGTLHAENDTLSNGYVVSTHKIDGSRTVSIDYNIACDSGNLYLVYVSPLNGEHRLALIENAEAGSVSEGTVEVTMPKGQNTIGVIGQEAVKVAVDLTLTETEEQG